MNLAPYPDAKYSTFPNFKQLGACRISYAMNIPLFEDIFINMLIVLWPNVCVVISKMLPCHHHNINSESNRSTSPASTFVLQVWGHQKKKRQPSKSYPNAEEGLFEDWILSSCSYTERVKNIKNCLFLHLPSYILAIQSLLAL